MGGRAGQRTISSQQAATQHVLVEGRAPPNDPPLSANVTCDMTTQLGRWVGLTNVPFKDWLASASSSTSPTPESVVLRQGGGRGGEGAEGWGARGRGWAARGEGQ